jgi:hypothetical protein
MEVVLSRPVWRQESDQSVNFFPLSIILPISYFISGVVTKKTAYKWTNPAEEAFLSVLAEAVNMGLGGKCDLFPRRPTYGRL